VNLHKNTKTEAQLTPAIQELVKNGFKIAVHNFGGKQKLLDFGNPTALLEGNEFLLENIGNDYGGSLTSIKNSSICSPSYIGKEVEITDCVIGPFVSIGNSCILKDCIIRNSVIGDFCVLEKIITENSIIGDHVVMDNLIKKDLIIGDRSNIRSSK
jgi:glucose-1-phosphate thymidylyltransferase